MLRHHYSVTTGSGHDDGEKWFHAYAEAESDYEARVDEARHGGANVSSPGYWRAMATSGTVVTAIRIDDAGLRACGPLCGGG